MIEAILFDLDDTLLANDTKTFIPGYFSLLARYAERYMTPERFLQELLFCTQQMMSDTNTETTNREVFWALFEQRTGLDPAEMESFFDRFYREQFPQLASLTQVRPAAVQLVRKCFELGLKVVIATNPVFPGRAIEERLKWAAVPVSDYAYHLVTTYENMHSTKPHEAYYVEILKRIGCQPGAALMVGDNWKHDINPPSLLGLHTFWINYGDADLPHRGQANGHGSLDDLCAMISSDWLEKISVPAVQHSA
jgi:FMN phosphatase YigB (HAD superfamily)